MPEKEDFLNNLVDSIADSVSKQKSVSFFEEEKSNSVVSSLNRLFGRQRPVHHILGVENVGPSTLFLVLLNAPALKNVVTVNCAAADVLLWRNKKISSSVLAGATAVWVLFEWLNYHFLTLLCFAVVLGMLAQFAWSNASGFLNR